MRVSQPSLSKMVKSLEADLGVVLFERGKRGVKLTSDGDLLYQKCQGIFEGLENLEQEFKNKNLEVSGSLKIGASDNLCNYILPKIFIEFWKKYPQVKVNIFSGTSSQIIGEVSDQKIEFGLFFTRPDEQRFFSEKLARVEFGLVCSSRNVRLRASGFNLKKLQESYFIGSRINDYTGAYPTLKMLEKLGIHPKLFFETNSQETQKKMAMEEYGYTVLPRFMVNKELKEGELLEIKTPQRVGADLFLVRRKSIVLTRQARVFEEFLRNYLKNNQSHLQFQG